MRSMYAAASGMSAQQTRLDSIANNLANVNTTGFKKSRENFQDLYYQELTHGGQAASTARIEVGSGAIFAGLASASRNVPAGRKIGGSPARRYGQWLREVAAVRQLPSLLRRFERLERLVHEKGASSDGT